MKAIHLLVGGTGFIANELIKSLLEIDCEILCIDDDTSNNFGTTNERFSKHSKIKFYLGDVNYETTIDWIIQQAGDSPVTIWHLAANSDIRSGSSSPNLDAQKTFLTSISVCNLIDRLKVDYVNFASTSAVYGELSDGGRFVEDSICSPISYYGIAKHSSEQFLEIKTSSSNVPLLIFRFANIVGAPATHGVIYDFIKKMKTQNEVLEVLGNGTQTKSYLHVESLVKMMLNLWVKKETGIFNLGPGDTGITVRQIAECVVDHLLEPKKIEYGESPRGWEGDAVRVLMDTSKLESIFAAAKISSSQAIHRAVHEIAGQLELAITCRNIHELNG